MIEYKEFNFSSNDELCEEEKIRKLVSSLLDERDYGEWLIGHLMNLPTNISVIEELLDIVDEIECPACRNAKKHAKRHGRPASYVTCKYCSALRVATKNLDVSFNNPDSYAINDAIDFNFQKIGLITEKENKIYSLNLERWEIIAQFCAITIEYRDINFILLPVVIASVGAQGEFCARHKAVIIYNPDKLEYTINHASERFNEVLMTITLDYVIDTCVFGNAVKQKPEVKKFKGRKYCIECQKEIEKDGSSEA